MCAARPTLAHCCVYDTSRHFTSQLCRLSSSKFQYCCWFINYVTLWPEYARPRDLDVDLDLDLWPLDYLNHYETQMSLQFISWMSQDHKHRCLDPVNFVDL